MAGVSSEREPVAGARIAALVTMLVVLGACTPDPTNTSGGEIPPDQAAYDVRYYDLAVHLHPERRELDGRLEVTAVVLHPIDVFLLDLDDRLDVIEAWSVDGASERSLDFTQEGGRLEVALDRVYESGDDVRVGIRYGGAPRVAPSPPWDGGFTWETTASGAPWIAVSCQGEGADLWWPVKDHPGDEPDSMRIRITAPDTLVSVSNGRLVDVATDGDGQATSTWHVGYPINPYTVSLNVAPYVHLSKAYVGPDGTSFPIHFWALPEFRPEAERLLDEYAEQLHFLEGRFGPYPFREDKAAIVQTPYLGMEHQSAVAYGDDFRQNAFGFDWLLLHELAHEWFGNLVTVRAWRDLWIHEGFATYAEALYAERLGGKTAYQAYIDDIRTRIRNRRPVVAAPNATIHEVYFDAAHRASDADIYMKGAFVLHMLRYLMGEEPFLEFLRRVAYPDPAREARLGENSRGIATDDLVRLAESVVERDLGWFFDAYLRTASLPRLEREPVEEGIRLTWTTESDRPFEMPLEIGTPGGRIRLDMRGGAAVLRGLREEDLVVDPEGWILFR